ncbi:hypothetical protein, partial [Terribacillus saccharophilus]
NLIIQNLIILGNKKLRTKDQIKEMMRQNKEKDIIQKYEKNLDVITYKEKILRKAADTIAWQLFGNDITTIRRLYKDIPPVEIYNSNLKHDIEVVEGIFKSNNNTFPLITDITSFIQVGDLIVREPDNPQIRIIELKEGKVNEKIEEIIQDYADNQCERKLYYELSGKDTKFQKQFSRYVKQQSKALKTANIINTGEGKDDVTGIDLKIINDVFYTQHYDGIISKMLEEVDKHNYSLRRIDECLVLGVYNTSKIPIHEGFEVWKKSMGIDFPTVNLISFINAPTAFPIFLHPFSIDDKVRLVNRDKTILISLDIKKWFNILEEKGLKVNLLTKKQTAKLNNVPSQLKSFEYNGQAIEIQYGEIKQILHDGIFERMFNQCVRPASLADFIKYGLSHVENIDF